MKKSIALLTSFFFLSLLSSCSDDHTAEQENPVGVIFTEENPLQGYLTQTGYDQQSTVMANTNHEMGFFFKPLTKGKINSIVVKLPVTDSNLTIRIWDLRENAVIRTETIDINSANTPITKSITPLELVKNKEYAITMNPDNYFRYHRTDLGISNHPITIGNIRINGTYLSNPSMQNPPFVTIGGMYNGDCSFNFLRTE